jgi:hypothetical protein
VKTLQTARDTVLRRWEQLRADNRTKLAPAIAQYAESPDREVEIAARQSAEGDPAALVELLLSDRPLTQHDRAMLAVLVSGGIVKAPNRARPRNEHNHDTAALAEQFLAQWQREAKRQGVRTHGHTDAMRRESVETVLGFLSWPNGGADAVIDLMKRPASRKK